MNTGILRGVHADEYGFGMAISFTSFLHLFVDFSTSFQKAWRRETLQGFPKADF
jgi:hypothetical protein